MPLQTSFTKGGLPHMFNVQPTTNPSGMTHRAEEPDTIIAGK